MMITYLCYLRNIFFVSWDLSASLSTYNENLSFLLFTNLHYTVFGVIVVTCYNHSERRPCRHIADVYCRSLRAKLVDDDVIKWKHFPRNWTFVPGIHRFPTQRPVTRSFDVFFDLRLNKRLSKQPWGWWFETPSWSLWRHFNVSDC